MLTDQDVLLHLEQLKQQYPQAFRYNFLFYAVYKSKGAHSIWIWLLALCIFLPAALLIELYLSTHWQLANSGLGSLAVMLLLMLYVPLPLKQAKHSSHMFYQQNQWAPLRLTVCIVLQSLNLMYWQSRLLESICLSLALGYGFIQFYREGYFLAQTQAYHCYALQQIRRVCWWSYQQTQFHRRMMSKSQPHTEQYRLHQNYLQQSLQLHLSLYQYEYQLCKQYKSLAHLEFYR